MPLMTVVSLLWVMVSLSKVFVSGIVVALVSLYTMQTLVVLIGGTLHMLRQPALGGFIVA
jgi:hypothetical protein